MQQRNGRYENAMGAMVAETIEWTVRPSFSFASMALMLSAFLADLASWRFNIHEV